MDADWGGGGCYLGTPLRTASYLYELGDDRHGWEYVTPDYYDERMATNLRHMFFAIQTVAPDMIAAGKGSIVNFGSNSWFEAVAGLPVYATAKAAVHGMTRSFARELGKHRIRVNTIVPGWVMTERQKAL